MPIHVEADLTKAIECRVEVSFGLEPDLNTTNLYSVSELQELK